MAGLQLLAMADMRRKEIVLYDPLHEQRYDQMARRNGRCMARYVHDEVCARSSLGLGARSSLGWRQHRVPHLGPPSFRVGEARPYDRLTLDIVVPYRARGGAELGVRVRAVVSNLARDLLMSLLHVDWVDALCAQNCLVKATTLSCVQRAAAEHSHSGSSAGDPGHNPAVGPRAARQCAAAPCIRASGTRGCEWRSCVVGA